MPIKITASITDLKLAQDLLAHAQLSTTSNIYVHLSGKVAGQGTEIIARELSCAQIVPNSEELLN